MRTFLSLLALLVVAAAGWAEQPAGLSADAQNALDVLLRAEAFCDGDFGAKAPDALKAFRLLSKDPQADAIFKHVAAKGSAAGQLYALSGLYFTDHDYFQKAAEGLRDSKTVVGIQTSCFGEYRKPVSAIIDANSPNAIRLNGPNDSLARWFSEHATQEAVIFDIAGGGYPARMRRPPQ